MADPSQLQAATRSAGPTDDGLFTLWLICPCLRQDAFLLQLSTQRSTRLS